MKHETAGPSKSGRLVVITLVLIGLLLAALARRYRVDRPKPSADEAGQTTSHSEGRASP